MFCGEVMPVKQLNIWERALPNARYVNYYGPSETTYACSYYIISKGFKEDESIPIGRAAYNIDILLIDELGDQIKESEKKGEIYIRGTGLAMGYYNDVEKIRERFVQNPILLCDCFNTLSEKQGVY